MSVSIFQPTFLKGWTGGESRPLSDSRVPLITAALVSLTAGQKDVSAVEAQVPVGFAATALATQLQPQKAAVTALLKVRQQGLNITVRNPFSFHSLNAKLRGRAELMLACVCKGSWPPCLTELLILPVSLLLSVRSPPGVHGSISKPN